MPVSHDINSHIYLFTKETRKNNLLVFFSFYNIKVYFSDINFDSPGVFLLTSVCCGVKFLCCLHLIYVSMRLDKFR